MPVCLAIFLNVFFALGLRAAKLGEVGVHGAGAFGKGSAAVAATATITHPDAIKRSPFTRIVALNYLIALLSTRKPVTILINVPWLHDWLPARAAAIT